ncbi:hypothetical protein BLA29_009121 [Euroglyphus maynei]|uniref:Uncharacterized protein n=1 Tax=Euroglyphus maynei TaxID=6958 RepID=A0A1Y3BMS4_EURMA|nr:hypothetical protein BLA29_009121 [Euroglyphus maynei]
MKKCQPTIPTEQLERQSNVKQYANAVTKLYDNNSVDKTETPETLDEYKKSVLQILFP